MKVDKEKKRLKAIRLKYVFFPTRCEKCGEEYKREKMWQCYRWGINKRRDKYSYCQDCMHSAEDVLNEIDTDEVLFGLADVDEPVVKKKIIQELSLREIEHFLSM